MLPNTLRRHIRWVVINDNNNVKRETDLDNGGFKRLFEVNKLAPDAELHLVKRGADFLDVFQESSDNIILMSNAW